MPLRAWKTRTVWKRSTRGSPTARERMQVIGMAHRDVLFVVVTVRDDDVCRIISARKATRHEQDRYYAGDCETW
ncbi:BrnT family toxin [Bradyrhizobium sp.]|uniref:BrnT family toxin n=1 Tax=Bradyrhizobium sp. TaxID=376 RepID=UPI0040379AF8